MEKIKDFELKALILKSLSHPTRLFMLSLLSKGPRCVCEITKAVTLDVSTVSKHLSILKNAKIVSVTKEGNKVIYSLRCSCVLEYADCLVSMYANSKNIKTKKCCPSGVKK